MMDDAGVWDRDGMERHRGALSGQLARLFETLPAAPDARPGHRYSDLALLSPFLIEGAAGAIAREKLGTDARPVRAILFDKTPGTNWSLAWHQDRTIAVRERAELQGFHKWTVKQGIQHVEPPFELLSRMVTLRLHLDDVEADNAPLLVAPGSHRFGLIPEQEIASTLVRCGEYTCLARRGDIWCYATPILHASQSSASKRGHRRVLQVDYSADPLPAPLQWLPT